MSGILWITSYIILILTVICLSFAVGALYRLLGKPNEKVPSSLVWPLANVMPGQRLDTVDLISAELFDLMTLKLPTEGFCLFVSEEQDMLQIIIPAISVAKMWKYPMLIITKESNELSGLFTYHMRSNRML